MAIEHENEEERPESRLLRCTECGALYPARLADGGQLAPMSTNRCRNCGNDQFAQVILDGQYSHHA